MYVKYNYKKVSFEVIIQTQNQLTQNQLSLDQLPQGISHKINFPQSQLTPDQLSTRSTRLILLQYDRDRAYVNFMQCGKHHSMKL